MAHEIEELDGVMLSGKAAWHGLGTVVDGDQTTDETIATCGLGWSVEKEPCYVKTGWGKYAEVPKRFLLVRDDLEKDDMRRVLGGCSDTYKIIQNTEAFAIGDALDARPIVESKSNTEQLSLQLLGNDLRQLGRRLAHLALFAQEGERVGQQGKLVHDTMALAVAVVQVTNWRRRFDSIRFRSLDHHHDPFVAAGQSGEAASKNTKPRRGPAV